MNSRGLVAHAAEGLTEWGLAGSLRYGAQDGLGPTAALVPAWGRAHAGGITSWWRHNTVADAASGSASDGRMELEVGYGVPSWRGVARPLLAITLRELGRDYRLGYAVQLPNSLRHSPRKFDSV